eukprot:NODE_136_length_18060_cov_0.656645.p4 type:complete len:363 gc:universal NODE_136_length_18060_cov_0.656645:4025-5113(+)
MPNSSNNAPASAAAPISLLGIANLPNQMYRASVKKGSSLTIMVVGCSGVGKTTFINTLFQTDLIPYGDYMDDAFRRSQQTKHTVDIAVHRAEIEEKGFRVHVNIVETNGFGDYCNNTEAWTPVVEFIDGQHESYLRQEMQPMREDVLDGRVHACLYFIRPTGHGLSPLDISTMKMLGSKVNLIPVIPKADTFTKSELAEFKQRIMRLISENNIQTFTIDPESDDESNTIHNTNIVSRMPFSTICGLQKHSVGGKSVLGRKLKWGVAEVENDAHSDFTALRSLLVRTHMLALIESTVNVHYERFRSEHIDEKGSILSALSQKDSKYKDLEEGLRKKFTEQVRAEEIRFKQWEQKVNVVNLADC